MGGIRDRGLTVAGRAVVVTVQVVGIVPVLCQYLLGKFLAYFFAVDVSTRGRGGGRFGL